MGYVPPDHRRPLRQGMAIASLALGVLSLPTLGCLGVGALAAIVLGIVALSRANRQPDVYGGKGLAIGGIVAAALSLVVAIPIGGIVAAIAIPSLLRARVSANESATIGDVRTVVAAQAAYQAMSGGHYGSLECLRRPKDCLPGYEGPEFIGGELAGKGVKSGYRRTFFAGPAAGVAPEGSGPAAAGLASFAYAAEPEKPGATGVRSFCGDSSGRVCAARSGPIDASGGQCPPPPACEDL